MERISGTFSDCALLEVAD